MSFLIVMPTIWPPYRDECVAGMAPALKEHLLVVDNSVRPNLGLAASWNLGRRRVLDEGLDWLVILSAATRFGPGGGEDFIANLERHPDACVVESSAPVNQHLFGMSRRCIETIGSFDENFWPIYGDDADFCYRVHLAREAGLLGEWANEPVDAWITMAGHAHKLAGVRTDFVLGWSYFKCVDPQTEMLTRRGFVSYDRLLIGEDVYTVAPDTGFGHWEPLKDLHVMPGPPLMIAMEGKSHSSLTTPNHRWLVQRRTDHGMGGRTWDWSWATTASLNSSTRIPIAAQPSDRPTEPKYSDAFVETVAWFWTEGTVHRRKVTIYQSREASPQYVDRIRVALTLAFGPEASSLGPGRTPSPNPAWREARPANTVMSHFRLNTTASAELLAVAPDKIVSPAFLDQLTMAQLRLFIETSIDADGHRMGSGAAIGQASLERLDAFQVACALAGRPSRLSVRGPAEFALTLGVRSTVTPGSATYWKGPNRFQIQQVPYSGIVWCPETASGTWLARRHGACYVTGNSKWGGLSGEQTFAHPFDDPALPLSFWPVPPDPRSIIGKDGRPDELRAEWETTA